MSQASSREEQLFHAALELPAGEQRAAFLQQACAGDEPVRERVEALLRAHDDAGAVLEPSAVTARSETTRTEPLTEKAGDRISRYKLLQEIGEGGCGVVYMAEQQEPVRRRVALKIIKLGMDTKQVVARFEAERQALAMMDHPNIAKVLDAGATDTGRPFFVMELVRGVPITHYCDQNNLSTRERLELFIPICKAIQHAHQKGIIHRDVKPSNILVTLHDGVPVPKVIDFGIAKAIDQPLTEKTLFTRFEQFMGTPAYMSPEQAEMSGLDIDTRTDVYSLGVLLYELLTGKTPFDPKELASAGVDAMRKAIREKEPLRPSTRISTLPGEDRTTTAKRRGADAPKLVSLIRGDLDWIAMKCLEKDRTRRYETANGLAMDIERYLQNEPVVARPPSTAYRFQKLVRRNKLAFAAAAAVFVALLAGLGISILSLVREKKARDAAVASAKAAQEEANKRRQMARFLQDMLARVSSQVAQGRDTAKLKEILGQTTTRFATELKDQPAVEAELRAALGMMYFDLGDYAAAAAMQQEGLRLKALAGETDSKTVAELYNQLGNALEARGDLDPAETAFRKSLELKKKIYGEMSSECADPLNDLGLLLWERGDLKEAEALYRQSLALKRKLPGDKVDLANTIGNVGLVLWEEGRLAEAEQYQRESLNMERALLGNHPDVSYACNNLALVLRDQGNLAEAEPLFREVIRLLPKDHPHNARASSHLAGVLRRRAATEANAALLHEALQLSPTQPLSADALANEYSQPAITPLFTSNDWRYAATPPAADWFTPSFSDVVWPVATAVSGFANYSPRSERAVIFHTNIWLRQQFDLPSAPTGKVVLRLNRSHDAEIFLNGVPATPTMDWSDTPVLVPCTAPLNVGRNTLAVHCGDVDGATTVGVAVYVSSDASLGRKQLLAEFDRLIQKEPQRAELYAGRASVRARLGQWTEAAADLSRAVALSPETLEYWYQLAPLLVETGNLTGYAQHRRDALNRFLAPDSPTKAAQVTELSLLTATDGPEQESATKLADFAGNAAYADYWLAWRQLAKGLAEYRQGRFASAVDWMEKVRATAARQDRPGWTHERERNRTAAALLVQAMAHHRLNQADEARTSLATATEIIQTQFPQLESGDVGRDWPDWLIAHILQREAMALIGGNTVGS